MKAIATGNEGPQWSNRLLSDLAFIKKNGRYPLSKKTIPSVLILVLFIFLALKTIAMVLTADKGHLATTLLLVPLLCIAVITIIVRYLRTLQFKSITTPFFADDNRKLVDEFLRSQQLNVYRHPNAPEVLQLLSRPLGNTDQREVMIFIADDKRILINSHFINQKWTINPQSHNCRRTVKHLKEWLAIRHSSTNFGVTVQ